MGDKQKIEFTHTQRGFALIKFTDRYDAECSLQKSSLASEDAIWFGVNDPKPKIMATQAARFGIDPGAGNGWVPFPLPDEVDLTTRMHLTRDMVAELLPMLQSFVDSGELPAGDEVFDKSSDNAAMLDNPKIGQLVKLIEDAQSILAAHIEPTGPSKADTIDALLDLLDGPRSRAALSAPIGG